MIPIQKPLLPPAELISNYLQTMDSTRTYTNFGSLVYKYEDRLAKMFGAAVVSASSATSALTATLLALELPPRSLIACPSWTFCATPASIIAAGHIPYFFDVDSDGKLSNPTIQKSFDAIIEVASFGSPIDLGKWDALSEEYELPVIIDAAAGFDAFSALCKPRKCPVVVSTHATKTFGTGEGGFVACTDIKLLDKIRNITNFGMNGDREIRICGFNGKMSEYHAAVGLASLDGWKEKRDMWIEVKKHYQDCLGTNYGDAREYATSSCVVTLQVPAKPVADKMMAMGVDTRTNVYGCHKQHAFRKFPSTSMVLTEYLMANNIYLPLFVDMTKQQVEYVCECLRKCVRESMI